jgi:cation transport ATPase
MERGYDEMSRFPEPGELYKLQPAAEEPEVEAGQMTKKAGDIRKPAVKSKPAKPQYVRVRDQTAMEKFEQAGRYVPAEILGPYIGVCSGLKMIKDAPGSNQHHLRIILFAVVFLASLAFTPIYAGKATQDARYRRRNVWMAIIAYLVWAYSYPVGLAQEMKWYLEPVALVVMFVFTLCSGLMDPKPAN